MEEGEKAIPDIYTLKQDLNWTGEENNAKSYHFILFTLNREIWFLLETLKEYHGLWELLVRIIWSVPDGAP